MDWDQVGWAPTMGKPRQFSWLVFLWFLMTDISDRWLWSCIAPSAGWWFVGLPRWSEMVCRNMIRLFANLPVRSSKCWSRPILRPSWSTTKLLLQEKQTHNCKESKRNLKSSLIERNNFKILNNIKRTLHETSKNIIKIIKNLSPSCSIKKKILNNLLIMRPQQNYPILLS